MRKISIYIGKGGAGKSTLAINLAGAYADAGKRVCVVDCDVQQTLCDIYGQHLKFDVRNVEPVSGYDIVILDHRNSHSNLNLADLVIVPMRPSRIDFESYRRSLAFIGDRQQMIVLTQWQSMPDDLAFKSDLNKLCNTNKLPFNTIKLRSIYKKLTKTAKTVFDVKNVYGASQARNEVKFLMGAINDRFK